MLIKPSSRRPLPLDLGGLRRPDQSDGFVQDAGQAYVVNEVRDWIDSLDDAVHTRIGQAIDTLADIGPDLGRPLVDTIHGSSIANLKELRPGTVWILFAFDPWPDSILLVAGDKSGRWTQWYREAIPLAKRRYERYLKDRRDEEDHPR